MPVKFQSDTTIHTCNVIGSRLHKILWCPTGHWNRPRLWCRSSCEMQELQKQTSIELQMFDNFWGVLWGWVFLMKNPRGIQHHANIQASRALFQYKNSFPCMDISVVEIRWSWDCLIFIMGIPIVRQHVYIETAPCYPPLILPIKNIHQNQYEHEKFLHLGQNVL